MRSVRLFAGLGSVFSLLDYGSMLMVDFSICGFAEFHLGDLFSQRKKDCS